MVVAPTRGGKAVSASVPMLLDHPGSAVVLDVKDGELALITAGYREEVLGQSVFIIDPFDVVCSRLGREPARLNPMDAVDLDGDEPFDNALLIAESCVIPESTGDSHWSGEAEALIAGLVLAEGQRRLHGETAQLADVRAALNLGKAGFGEYVGAMFESPYALVRGAAGRISNKADRERSGVISTAHRNTHFLESAKLAASLSASDIDLSRIGENTSVYIVLPARRIRSAKRWLRLLIAGLIGAVTALPRKPDPPVLFLLEEMATLERLSVVEQSFGLMAGYGLQLCGIVQDFTQLRDLYRDRWETFLANSAAIQCFGTNDLFTARYLSELCGRTTVEQLGYETALRRSSLFGDPDYRSERDSMAPRQLITTDELMGMHPCVQLIVLASARPVMAYRPAYFLDARYRDRRGKPLYDVHPHHADKPLAPALDFLKAGLDLGGALAPWLEVG
jgi:type IV secretion system protein VirD4